VRTIGTPWRSILVPLLVLALGLGAGLAIGAMYRSADESRKAQVQISGLPLELQKLEAEILQGPDSGHSVARSEALVEQSKTRIDGHLRHLNEDASAPSVVKGLARSFERLYPAVDDLIRSGPGRAGSASRPGAPPGPSSGQPSPPPGIRALSRTKAAILNQFDRANRAYDARASSTRARATVGSAATLLLLLGSFLLVYRRSSQARTRAEELATENKALWQASHDDSITDALTGLRNRRALDQAFSEMAPHLAAGEELMVAMFDLDGFKRYNDTFGHGPGDKLLSRLGERLVEATEFEATAYRMGGDEFCIMSRTGTEKGLLLVEQAAKALSDDGDGWHVGCSYGLTWVPSEAQSMTEALRIADQRMYARKASRSSASQQTAAALVQVLVEQGGPQDGGDIVAQMAVATAKELGMEPVEAQRLELAAELHDIGKAAIPDTILNKPGALNEAEWEFVRRHTIIGERIILAAPSLEPVAKMVRSSHERVDGYGYPDDLSGEAMSDDEAVAELNRCAGTQFDSAVVTAFRRVLASREATAAGTTAE
jgi:diguanylate cyclase (GGDEF)-like protein